MNGAKRVIPSADMNVTTFVKRISLGSFYMKVQARRSHLRVNGHVRNTQMLIRHKTCETGNSVNSANLKRPKFAKVQAAQNIQWLKQDKSKSRKMVNEMSVVGRQTVAPCDCLMLGNTL